VEYVDTRLSVRETSFVVPCLHLATPGADEIFKLSNLGSLDFEAKMCPCIRIKVFVETDSRRRERQSGTGHLQVELVYS